MTTPALNGTTVQTTAGPITMGETKTTPTITKKTTFVTPKAFNVSQTNICLEY